MKAQDIAPDSKPDAVDAISFYKQVPLMVEGLPLLEP